MTVILSLAVIIFSIILHEVAHGYVADKLGDGTARYSGRLTLNPLPHIDPIGSLLIPAILIITGSPFLIGWAKPVPYNPYNLRNQRWGEAMVAAVGPLTNILLALIFGFAIRLGFGTGWQAMLQFLVTAVYTNLILAFYNLIPLPPLDGSRVLRSILPARARAAFGNFERTVYGAGPFGLVVIGLVAIYFLWPVLSNLVQTLFGLITGA